MIEASTSLAAACLAISRALGTSMSLMRESLGAIRAAGTPASDRLDALVDRLATSRGAFAASMSLCRRIVDDGLAVGIYPITIDSDLYPESLRTISDAPPLIFFRGSMSALSLVPGVAVVGTRKATSHGLTIAERLAQYLSDSGVSVVSGLALGIDAAAHEGALKGVTPTIAVLAHGLEKASPRANALLADRILDQGGAWISEYPYKAIARPEFFVHRNRIQVGLSRASVIVEGEVKSGSATQAEFCIRNRRVLFAVLPEQNSKVSTAHALPKLLVEKRGAIALSSKDDYPKLLEAMKISDAAD